MTARDVYDGSDAKVTRDYYARLKAKGIVGEIALNLMRAHKASTRAKKYKGNYIGMAYERKQWSLEQMLHILNHYGEQNGITYGWKEDNKTIIAGRTGGWLLYIDLPTGQVSFHAPSRGQGPDYKGEWCGANISDIRILRYCDNVLGDETENLSALYKKIKKEAPLYGGERGARRREGWKRRLESIKNEIAHLAGEEVRHIELQAEYDLVQTELFA